MLAYYISQSNEYTFRTQATGSTEFTMSLQDMYTLQNLTMSMASMSYNAYESFVGFTGSISGAYQGAEYRATLYNQGAQNITSNATGNAIWQGSIQVYASQSIDKSVYENQIPPITSHASENRYIILN
jgi:hypothetical protein